MKAEFTYSSGDVEAMILAYHAKQFPTPEGMVWAIATNRYGSRDVTIEAVEKAPEGGAG